MKKLFLRAEFGPLWEPWGEDEIGRKVEAYGGSENEIGRKCILQAENIMPGSKKL